MEKRGKITTDLGTVYWRNTPTKMDRVGCEGMYVSKVVLSKITKRAASALARRIVNCSRFLANAQGLPPEGRSPAGWQ